MDLAPIALFAFNRPDHLRATLAALAANELAAGSELTVFCDGPRSEEDDAAVTEVRAIARAAGGFRRVQVVERSRNLGLASSVIRGVGEMLAANDTVIVLEDDLVTSPWFLSYMNDALREYAGDERVISACGYGYPLRGELPETYFLTGAHCWGWATWRRGWTLFEKDPVVLLRALEASEDLLYEFDRAGSYPHTQFLQQTAAGDGDSWALRWMATAILHGKLTLYPYRSLVANIGMDASGTNAPKLDVYRTPVADRRPAVGGIEVQPNARARALLRRFHIEWRKTWKPKFRLYYTFATLLPERTEKKIYARVVRRALTNIRSEHRLAEDDGLRRST